MKLVQSLLANRIVDKSEFLNDSTWGTTPEQRLFYWCSWVWSFMSGHQHYKHFELVADEYGRIILSDILQLPYSHIRQELDGISHEYWFLAKIKAYSIQNEPFVHYDGDVIFRDAFPHNATTFNLYGQHLSNFRGHYSQIYLLTKFNNMQHIPDELNNIDLNTATKKDFEYINSGIFGGKDLDLIKESTEKTFLFYKNDYNKSILKSFYKLKTSLVAIDDLDSFEGGLQPQVSSFSYFEELLPIKMYKRKYGNLEGLGTFLKVSENVDKYADVNEELQKQSTELKYVHLMDLKREYNPNIENENVINTVNRVKSKIIAHVAEHYPDYYKRITKHIDF